MSTPEDKIGTIIEVASGGDREVLDWHQRAHLKEVLQSYSEEMVERIHRILTKPRNALTRGKSYLASGFVDILMLGLSETKLNEFLGFAPRLASDHGFSLTMISGLHHYTGLEQHEDYSTASKTVQLQCLSLIRVATAMMEYVGASAPLAHEYLLVSYPERWISDERISSMILTDPNMEKMIISIVKEHERADFGLIEALLHDGNLPMSAGTL